VTDALDTLPPDIAAMLDNVAVTVEDEPPPGERLLGLYRGIPHTRRTSGYAGAVREDSRRPVRPRRDGEYPGVRMSIAEALITD